MFANCNLIYIVTVTFWCYLVIIYLLSYIGRAPPPTNGFILFFTYLSTAAATLQIDHPRGVVVNSVVCNSRRTQQYCTI